MSVLQIKTVLAATISTTIINNDIFLTEELEAFSGSDELKELYINLNVIAKELRRMLIDVLVNGLPENELPEDELYILQALNSRALKHIEDIIYLK